MSMFAELKGVIVRSGMSRDRIAREAGCHPATLANWLDGRVKDPRLSTLIAVAKVFGKSIVLTEGRVRLVDTPASVAAKVAGAREYVGLWRRYQ